LAKPKSISLASLLLLAIFLIALVLRTGVAIHFPSIEYADEIYNTLEPAHLLAYGYGLQVWEWREGARSWVLPAVLAGLMRATDWMGPGSLGYIRAIVVTLSLLSLTTVWFGYAWSKRASGKAAAIIAACACAISPPLIYFAPKAFYEVVAGNLLLPGLYFGMYGEALSEKKRLFLAGLFLGSAVSLRLQLAPAVVFAALYFSYSNWRRRGPALFAGLLLPVIAFGLVDAFTWSYPFQSFFLYFWVNVVEGRSQTYGAESWYWYLSGPLLTYLGPLLLLALAGVRRSPFLGWIVLLIVASHSVLAHKEARFVYPAVPILVTLAALGVVEAVAFFNAHRRSPLTSRAITVIGLALFILASAFLAWRFPRWSHNSGGLIALDKLSWDPSVCGVGLYWVPWFFTGGYTHLHQNVPIVVILPTNPTPDGQMPYFNALLAGRTFIDPNMGFKLAGCWNGVCLYRRPGSCMASSPYELDKMLQHSGN